MFFVLAPKFTYSSMRASLFTESWQKRNSHSRIIPRSPVSLELSDLCIFNCAHRRRRRGAISGPGQCPKERVSSPRFHAPCTHSLSLSLPLWSDASCERTGIAAKIVAGIGSETPSTDRPRFRTRTYHPKSLIYRSRTTIAILPKRNVATHTATPR